MSREWKVGDVATVRCDSSEWHPALRVQMIDGEDVWVCSVSGAQPSRFVVEARPLVVIDPEDRELLERFVVSLEPEWGFCGYEQDETVERRPLPDVVDEFQRALREFADPTPPKPDEPQGLGAVVATHEDGDYIRISLERERPWQNVQDGSVSHWGDVAAVRVLSPGVASDD